MGLRRFWVIAPEALQPYLEWCERTQRVTGPIKARRTQVEKVHAKSCLTLAEAAQISHIKVGMLAAAAQRGQLRCKKIAGLRAVSQADLAAYQQHRSDPG
ncbi:MAG: helix-turn-helix domain-containing protein, partial [Anaerolineae bacterium]|nr:helix-turn-helix domain-containing protein [Anaerolineae bacterium]